MSKWQPHNLRNDMVLLPTNEAGVRMPPGKAPALAVSLIPAEGIAVAEWRKRHYALDVPPLVKLPRGTPEELLCNLLNRRIISIARKPLS
jgi:hypothetical protein